ncbi:MAG TPA: TatD family hydrolase [Pseudomonadales bacterium]
MLVDSHCHLNYLDDPQARVREARAAGVVAVLCIGVDAAHIGEVLALARSEPDVWASVGQHPEAAASDWNWIEPLLDQPRVVAVGETGLDYYHSDTPGLRRRQRQNFEHQLSLASRYDLPVVVHTRSAEADTLALIRSFPDVVGVLHCFTESWALAEAAIDLGYYISISGIVTFRNGENVRAVARQVPADRLLVETDAPWLAPVPHRGRQNQPAYVVDTAGYLAELRGTDLPSLAEQTSENFRRLFARAVP